MTPTRYTDAHMVSRAVGSAQPGANHCLLTLTVTCMHALEQPLTPPSMGGSPLPPPSLRFVADLPVCRSPATICSLPLLVTCMAQRAKHTSQVISQGAVPASSTTKQQQQQRC